MGHFDFDFFLNLNNIRLIDWNFYFIWDLDTILKHNIKKSLIFESRSSLFMQISLSHLLLDGVWDFDFLPDWIRLWNLDVIRLIDWNLDFIWNLLDDFIRLGHIDLFLVNNWNLLDHLVWSWNVFLDVCQWENWRLI